MREYCIFTLNEGKLFIEISNSEAYHYAVKAYVKDCYLQDKESLILTQIKFTEEEMIQLLDFGDIF